MKVFNKIDEIKIYTGLKHFLLGAILTSTILSIFFIFFSEKYFINNTSVFKQIKILLTCLSGAFVEEFLFTYLCFSFLKKSINLFSSIIITSILFALLHLGNSNSTYISVISHFLGSTIYISAFIMTHNIFTSIGLHFGWNYVQIICSQPMSGTLREGAVSLTLPSNTIWFGNEYGIEGGIYSIILRFILISILVVFYYYSKSNRSKNKSKIGLLGSSFNIL